MNNEKTGGAAFPTMENTSENGSYDHRVKAGEKGLTVLDYMAANAMHRINAKPAGLLEWLKWAMGKKYMASYPNYDDVARVSYAAAAAMLRERQNYIS
jgi:hypothetical protein